MTVDQPEPDSLASSAQTSSEGEFSIVPALIEPIVQHRWLIVLGSLLVGALAMGGSYAIAPTFSSTTTFLPSQQQQSAAAAALASLGSLASLAGGAAGLRTSGDQYVTLMQSATLSDRIIDRFGLMKLYEAELRVDARETLQKRVRINVGKRDGLITVEVDDESPQRAADIANRYVDELRETTANIAITEAQQRRQFFEGLLSKTRDQLTAAQRALESSGFSAGALRAEPRAAAEGYARLKAEATAAEIRLQTLRGTLTDETPEVRQLTTQLSALRALLARQEQAEQPASDSDYIGKYREFKYRETLFELYARQFELARADEARDGGLIQVVDAAKPAERKSKPKRAFIALSASALAAFVLLSVVVTRSAWRRAAARPGNAERLARLQSAPGRSQ